MIYQRFRLERFRGVADVSINLTRGDLVLLLGLNESGKTSILRGIELFDFRNDPAGEVARSRFLTSVRNKADMHTSEPAVISASIALEDSAPSARRFTPTFKRLKEDFAVQQLFETLWKGAVEVGEITIKRVFPFNDGHPDRPHYRFADGEPLNEHPRIASVIRSHKKSLRVAQALSTSRTSRTAFLKGFWSIRAATHSIRNGTRSSTDSSIALTRSCPSRSSAPTSTRRSRANPMRRPR